MSTQNKLKNVILIYGDPSFYSEKLIKIKRHFFPNMSVIPPYLWKEIDVPHFKKKSKSEEKWINVIDSEITCSSWGDDKKFIILRELVDSAVFLKFLFNILKNIPQNNYLILCDKKNVLNNGKSSFNKLRWGDLIQSFSPYITSVNTGSSISALSVNEKVNYIVDEFKKYNKKISKENSSALLEIVGDNKLMLNGEIKKISFAIDNDKINKDDILELAFPMSQNYPVWLFYSAINTGSYSKTMEASEKLLENKFKYDSIIILSLKQIRWQVIYSHLLLKYGNVNKCLSKFSISKNMPSIKKELCKMKTLTPLILNKFYKEKEAKVKQENIPSFFNNKDILTFINEIMPKYIVDKNNNLKQVILNKNMKRYLNAHDGLVELRTASANLHSSIFSNTIRKISIIK